MTSDKIFLYTILYLFDKVNIHKLHLITYILLAFSVVSPSQNYVADVEYYSTKDGLSHRQTNTVYEGSEKFIWIGTNYGLNRFDGHTFRVFTKEKHGLLNNEIHRILEDNEGWLWLMTIPPVNTQHISLFNIHTHEVKTIAERFGASCQFVGKDITNMVMGPDKKIYISLENSVYQIDRGKVKRLKVDDDKSIVNIKSVTFNHRLLGFNFNQPGSIELIELDTLGQQIWSYTIKSLLRPRDNMRFFEDAKGIRWLFLKSEIFNLFPKENIPRAYSIPEIPKDSLAFSKFLIPIFISPNAEQYWYRSNKQLVIVSPDGRVLFNLGEAHPEMIKNTVIKIKFDNNNNAWVLTNFGFYRVQLYASSFTNYLHLEPKVYNLHDAFSARGIAVSNGKILVNSILTKRYSIDSKTGNKEEFLSKGWAQGRSIRPILLVEKDGAYMGTNKHLIYVEDEKIQQVFDWKKNATIEMIWSIHQDSQQHIWMGLLSYGLAHLEGDSIANFNHYNGYESLAKSSVYSFLQWDAHHIIIGSTSGIYILHSTHGIIGRFSMEDSSGYSLPFDLINHLHRDQKEQNVIWAATGGGGLLKIKLDIKPKPGDSSLKSFTIESLNQFTIADGLSHNTLYAVYPDEHDNLWLSSDYGIICFNKSTQSTRIYTTTNGLPFNEFNRISHFQDQDGKIFMGTMNGITSFYPDNLLGTQDSFNFPLVITRYQKFDRARDRLVDLTYEIKTANELILYPEDQFFILEFALLEFKNAALTKYSYKIDGQGDDWIYIQGNSLRISGLPYGKFNLRIRAQGAQGQFSINQLSIPLQVLRPFYLKVWFILATAILILFGVLLIFRRRTKVLRMRQTELEKQVAERTQKINTDKRIIVQQAETLRKLDTLKSRFFANISHELRTPLTLILAPIEDTLTQKAYNQHTINNLLTAQRNGKKLQKKINEILDLTKLEAGALKLYTTKINWSIFFKSVVANFESLAKIKHLNFISTYHGDSDLQIELDVDKMEIILDNLLSNAFKFTPKKGTITITSQVEGDHLIIQIEDTGTGIAPDDLPNIFDRFYQSKHENSLNEWGTGIGLAIVKELIQLMGGEINVDSQLGVGSTFKILLPQYGHSLSTEAFQSAQSTSGFSVSQASIPEVFSPKIVAQNHQLPTLLIVEDNLDLQALISNLFSTDYNLINVFNGKEALEWLSSAQKKQHKADLIISDVMMPMMDGFQLLEVLKSEYTSIPVIMLTARGGMSDKLKALRIGVDDYITKPFSQVELKARVENLIKNAQSRQAYLREEEVTIPSLETIKASVPLDISIQEWLSDLEEKAIQNCGDYNYTIEELAHDMNMGKRQLSRRMKAAIGLTPGQYLKTVRLIKARKLLLSGETKAVKTTAFAVGYRDVGYFSKAFHKEFGKHPSDFLDA